ncbi:MAG: YihA family ribosome biogenesis GTP-binding protein [Eubacterium sp.]|nr:YihA family ribosome biogenesis GTP-binding protein [Eubacterium sp.]
MNYQQAQFEQAFGISAQLPPSELPEIAFAGRSNVGKSSLLNRLFNRKQLARVSSVPGKTVTINFYRLDGCRFVDLPGYGYAKISKQEKERFAELMEGYFNSDRQLKLVVQLVDLRHKPSADDYAMIAFLKDRNIPFIVVQTKRDKLKVKEYQKRISESAQELSAAGDVTVIPFSALTGEGADQIKQCIEEALTNV